MSRATLMTLIVAMALMVTACSSRQQQWETARRADTLEAYQNFLQTYPDGEFASQAQARVRELQESSDWQKAMQADTADAYQQFINQHPQGRMADEARIRLGNCQLQRLRRRRQQAPHPPMRAHIASSSARSRAAINRPWVNGDAFRPSIRNCSADSPRL